MNCPGIAIAICPPNTHTSFDASFSAGMPATSTVGAPGAQGAGVTGVHGIGVSTPSAAAVAAATAGKASHDNFSALVVWTGAA